MIWASIHTDLIAVYSYNMSEIFSFVSIFILLRNRGNISDNTTSLKCVFNSTYRHNSLKIQHSWHKIARCIHLVHVCLEKKLQNRKEETFYGSTWYQLYAQMYTDISLCQLTNISCSKKRKKKKRSSSLAKLNLLFLANFPKVRGTCQL